MWRHYLKLLGGGLVVLSFVATFRDLTDDEDDAWLVYVSRIVLCLMIGIGLMRRNRWAVRCVYLFGIPTLAVLVAGTLLVGPPLSTTKMVLFTLLLVAFSVTVFVPSSDLSSTRPNRHASQLPGE